jgi:hypothetical protein
MAHRWEGEEPAEREKPLKRVKPDHPKPAKLEEA